MTTKNKYHILTENVEISKDDQRDFYATYLDDDGSFNIHMRIPKVMVSEIIKESGSANPRPNFFFSTFSNAIIAMLLDAGPKYAPQFIEGLDIALDFAFTTYRDLTNNKNKTLN